MNFEEGNNNYDTRSLILDAIKEQRNMAFLELCYVIYEATDNHKEAKTILKYLQDQELVRQIQRLEAITEENENKIYYYDKDTVGTSKLEYRVELEKNLRTIRNEQLKTLAKILKELNDEEEVEL